MIKKNTKHISKKLPTAFKMLSATTNLLTFAYLFSVNREVRFTHDGGRRVINYLEEEKQQGRRFQFAETENLHI